MNRQGLHSNQSRQIGCGALTGHDGKGSKRVAPGHPWKIPLKAQGNPLATASSGFQSELPGKKEIDVHQSQTLEPERCSNEFLQAAAWNLCAGLEQLRKEQGCLLPLLANDFLKKLELLKSMEDILQCVFNQLAGLEVPKETGILTNLAEENTTGCGVSFPCERRTRSNVIQEENLGEKSLEGVPSWHSSPSVM